MKGNCTEEKLINKIVRFCTCALGETTQQRRMIRITRSSYLYTLWRRLFAQCNPKLRKLLFSSIFFASSGGGLAEMKMSRELLSIMQNHYPGRLGIAFMYNAPWAFSLFWKLLYPFVAEETKQKIIFAERQELFLEYVEAPNLEIDYGGTDDFKYNFQEHWMREDHLFPLEHFSDELD